MKPVELHNALKALGYTLPETTFAAFETYLNMVLAYNTHTNVTAHRDLETLREKGIYDSLLFHEPTWWCGDRLLDLGSGAGFPGIPLSLAYPFQNVVLLEPIVKKATLLNMVKDALKLSHIDVMTKRAEQVGHTLREQFDVVTSRAVARLPILLELAIPLVKMDGVFLAFKSKDFENEMSESKQAMQTLGCHIHKVIQASIHQDEKRVLIVFKKDAPTPLKYPRMFSQIKKTPL
jgi:16S rRNA (guanine527-N7)-methyltransferase